MIHTPEHCNALSVFDKPIQDEWLNEYKKHAMNDNGNKVMYYNHNWELIKTHGFYVEAVNNYHNWEFFKLYGFYEAANDYENFNDC